MYVLLAVAEGFLSQPGVDGEGVRQCFGRGLRKEGSFWGLAELEDLQAWVVDRTAGKFCRWDADRHEQELGRIEYLLAFLEQHWSLFPGGGEEWSQMFKLSLCLREDREADRRLLGRVVEGLQQHRYHAQITLRNMKFLLEFFRHPLNEKECQYYPQRSGATLLANYSEEEIENFLSKSAIGMEWDSLAVQSYFLACVKMGITPVTAKLIVAMIRYCLRTSKTAELLAAYELNLTKIFIFMKYLHLHSDTLSSSRLP